MLFNEQTEGRLAEADERFQAALASLKGPDGQPIYTADEQTRRTTEARERYEAAINAVQEQVASYRTDTDRQLAQLGADLASTLTTAELQRAEALRGFVSEDAARLDLATLRDRVAAAAAGNDRALAFLWERYALQRLDQVKDIPQADRPAARQLRELLPLLRTMVEGSERQKQRSTAAADRQRAEQAQIAINRRRIALQRPARSLVTF